MQRRWTSLIESVVNTSTGFIISVAVCYALFPVLGYSVPLADNALITAVMMGIGAVRGYLYRRLFEWLRVTGRFR
jgi:hypothetical protein